MPKNPQKTLVPRSTALSTEVGQVSYIRGRAITELARSVSFGEAIFLLLQGRLPTRQQRKMFEAVLVMAIDHGPNAPSADVARRVASTGNPLNTAIAAGVAAIGDHHGGAIENIGKLFFQAMQVRGSNKTRAEKILAASLQSSGRIPGYGHRVYTKDIRVTALFKLAKELHLPQEYIRLATVLEKSLAKHKGKKIPINIDGGMAAVLLTLGFPWQVFRGVFIIARTPGLAAQAWEQVQREPPVVRSREEFVYDGPPIRVVQKKRKAHRHIRKAS